MTYIAKFDHQGVGTFEEFEDALKELENYCDLEEDNVEKLYDIGQTHVYVTSTRSVILLEIEEQE